MQKPHKPTKITPAQAEALAKRDRNRLILMTVAVVILGGGYVVTQVVGDKYREDEEAERPLLDIPEEDETLFTFPEFDKPESLEGIRDATPEQRVLVDSVGFDDVFAYGRIFSERHYDLMDSRPLDAAVIAEIEADPSAHRAKPFVARGIIEALITQKRPGQFKEEYIGTLRLEDGSAAHFAVHELKDSVEVGDFARVNGMFLQIYDREAGTERRVGPYLLGAEAVRSYPAVEFDEAALTDALETVEDDRTGMMTGIPFHAQWMLMAKAASPDVTVDWAAAPELDSEILTKIFEDGESFRGAPFRVPISTNLGSWTNRAGENPLRLEKFTTGWIGNFVWKGAANAIKFIAPVHKPELRDFQGDAHLVTARGYFLKNENFDQRNGKPGRVPYFVLESVDVFTPNPDNSPVYIMWGVLAGAMFLVVLIWVLLMNDKKKSAQLQEELVRRRRARREQRQGELAAQEP